MLKPRDDLRRLAAAPAVSEMDVAFVRIFTAIHAHSAAADFSGECLIVCGIPPGKARN